MKRCGKAFEIHRNQSIALTVTPELYQIYPDMFGELTNREKRADIKGITREVKEAEFAQDQFIRSM